jgi:pantothenate synthetase
MDRDLQLLDAEHVDAVLAPSAHAIYKGGHSFTVDPGDQFARLAEGGTH